MEGAIKDGSLFCVPWHTRLDDRSAVVVHDCRSPVADTVGYFLVRSPFILHALLSFVSCQVRVRMVLLGSSSAVIRIAKSLVALFQCFIRRNQAFAF